MPLATPLAHWLIMYRYAIAYPLGVVEGPVIMMLSGFLVHTGFFDFWPIYLILVGSDLTGDVVWYFVGRRGGRALISKYGHFVNLNPKNVEKAESFFLEHQNKILIISKLTTGFGFAIATLVAAGISRVPFKRYMTINFFGEFIWAGFLFSIGYFLGNLYYVVDKSLRWGFITGIVVIGALLVYGFGKFMRAKFGGPPLLKE